MWNTRKIVGLACVVLLMTASLAWPRPVPGSRGGIMVGRISDVEGQLLRYVPADKDWVATVKDAPFGLEDALYSDENGKAEFILPNNSLARIGGNTQIQLITLKPDVTEVDVGSGVARFFNKSSNGVVKVTTPFGYVMAPPGTEFDLYVGDESQEVIGLRGTVDFVHGNTNEKYDVAAGAPSIVADNNNVASGEGSVDTDWDRWNDNRDTARSRRSQPRGESVRYLPQNLADDAYDLDENGKWDKVYYDGAYRTFWHPVSVGPGWAPFTVGRWTVWSDDNCWVPAEPFGYVTHHYGNWVPVDGTWYWAPPVTAVGVRVGPALNIGFHWYPGRVAWLHSNDNIGWVPLAPMEPYYAHHPWGPRAVVIDNRRYHNVNVNRYAYINNAVIINKTNIYNVNNYSDVRVVNVNKSNIVNNFRAAPVINDRVVNDYNRLPQRYAFTNAPVAVKPHKVVLNRIERNIQTAKQPRFVNAPALRGNVAAMKTGAPSRSVVIDPPRVSNRLVPPHEAGRPGSEMQFQQKPLKTDVRQVAPKAPLQAPVGARGSRQEAQPGQPEPAEGRQNARPPRPGQRVPQDRVGQPTEPDRRSLPPGEGTGRIRPLRPERFQQQQPGETGQTLQPRERPRRIRPPRPSQGIQPGVQPGLQPGEAGQPQTPSEQIRPRRPRPFQERQLQPGEPGRLQTPLEPTQPRRIRPPREQQAPPVESGPSQAPSEPMQPRQLRLPRERQAPLRQLSPQQAPSESTQPQRIRPQREFRMPQPQRQPQAPPGEFRQPVAPSEQVQPQRMRPQREFQPPQPRQAPPKELRPVQPAPAPVQPQMQQRRAPRVQPQPQPQPQPQVQPQPHPQIQPAAPAQPVPASRQQKEKSGKKPDNEHQNVPPGK